MPVDSPAPALPHPDDPEPLLGALRLAFFTPVREYPPLSDKKAMILLAVTSLMITVLLAFSKTLIEILSTESPTFVVLTSVLLVPLVVLVLVAAWFAFESLYFPIPAMPDSLAFYTHIMKRSSDEYRAQVLSLDYRRSIEAILHYNYSLATLSALKFQYINWSFLCVRYALASEKALGRAAGRHGPGELLSQVFPRFPVGQASACRTSQSPKFPGRSAG